MQGPVLIAELSEVEPVATEFAGCQRGHVRLTLEKVNIDVLCSSETNDNI